MRRRNGSIASANTPTNLSADQVEIDFHTYRCMVIEVYYIDNERNFTFGNKQVTYDCMILGGRKEGQVIANAKLMGYLGGEFNYHERVLRKAESPFNGPGKVASSEQKGDIVYITFVGKTSNPIIIGLGTHFLDKDTTGATRADGPIWREQYNGVSKLINKLGEFEFQVKGGEYSDAKGFLTPNSTFKTKINITEQKASIEMDSGTKVEIDGGSGIITIDVDGGANLITINKDGSLTIKASTKVSITAPLVDVGENASFSSTLFENLLTEYSNHTHQSTSIIAHGSPGITTPPLQPLISLVGSQSVKVKD